MFPTVEEHQGMARAAGADRMQNHGPRYPGDHRRISLNRYTSTNGEVRHARPTRPDPDRPLNVVYWPNGVVTENEDPSTLDVSCITHLIYTGTTVAYDGNVRLSDDIDMGSYSRARTEALEACRALRNRNPNLKIFVSLGGGQASREAFKMVAGNERLSRTFGHSARQLASQHDIDGIELDWTHAANLHEAESFIKLAATTEGYLGQDYSGQSYQLCVALPGLHSTINLFSGIRDINRLLDFINVRSFDLPAPTPNESYHISPASIEDDDQLASVGSPQLRSFSRALVATPRQASWFSIAKLLEARGANMRKVTLGIPCFGLVFQGASGPGQQYVRKDVIAYKALPISGSKEVDGAETGVAYATLEGDLFISYELPATVRKKAEAIKSKGMAGFCYSNGAQDSQGDKSLIRSGLIALTSGTNGG